MYTTSKKAGYSLILIKKDEMTAVPSDKFKDGAQCKVIGGTHAGKSGVVRDIKTGKTGHVSITVVQANGVRFKTLAKNVEI
jgi:ribosomal protein S4E